MDHVILTLAVTPDADRDGTTVHRFVTPWLTMATEQQVLMAAAVHGSSQAPVVIGVVTHPSVRVIGLFFAAVFALSTPSTVRAAGVVGSGSPDSCTDAALNTALAGGGLVTFDCGGGATIDISTGTGTKTIAADTTIDGGGLITIISGGTTPGDVFVVPDGVEFTAENLTIGNSSHGIVNRGLLMVRNCTFARNRENDPATQITK